jgi:ribosomal protein S18 acetylase RimI-like enzyme
VSARIEIASLSPGELFADLDAIVEIYRAAFRSPPYSAGETQVQEFRYEVLPQHVRRRGLRFLVAREAGRIVGFAYGYTGERGQWWTDAVARAMSPERAAEWLGCHFEFAYLAVHPEHQRRGIGGTLHDALLEGLPHRTALLSTLQAKTPAMRLYRRKGWQVLLTDFFFPGGTRPFVILGLRLPSAPV